MIRIDGHRSAAALLLMVAAAGLSLSVLVPPGSLAISSAAAPRQAALRIIELA